MSPRGNGLVTGAGSGIGRAVALRAAADGYFVWCLGRRASELHHTVDQIVRDGGQALAAAADVTQRAALEQTIAELIAQHGPVRALVNNAGAGKSAAFAKMSDDLWEEMVAVNLTSVYNVSRAIVPAMIEAGGGRIVNIASVAGLKGYPYISAYCAAKHGVVGLTRALAVELAGKNITVNAVCPGYVDTGMTAQTVANMAQKTGRSLAECRQQLEAFSPQRRLFTPDEVAATVSYLLSPAAAGINGQAIVICGGELAG